MAKRNFVKTDFRENVISQFFISSTISLSRSLKDVFLYTVFHFSKGSTCMRNEMYVHLSHIPGTSQENTVVISKNGSA